jgi:uncharacterized phage-associated protein
MLSCDDAAKYFLAQVSEDAGDLISNLKLQKLLYYAQGFHLALYDEPLFPEAIEAWTHGPVVPDLYRHYKKYGAGAIPCPEDIEFSIYDEETKSLLDAFTLRVWAVCCMEVTQHDARRISLETCGSK